MVADLRKRVSLLKQTTRQGDLKAKQGLQQVVDIAEHLQHELASAQASMAKDPGLAAHTGLQQSFALRTRQSGSSARLRSTPLPSTQQLQSRAGRLSVEDINVMRFVHQPGPAVDARALCHFNVYFCKSLYMYWTDSIAEATIPNMP